MTKFLLALLLMLPLSCNHKTTPIVELKSPIEQQHLTTHRIGLYAQFAGDPDENFGEDGHCSGTAIGPHAILTAQHCFKDSTLIRIDADTKPTKILAALIDGNDHVIYIVEHDFTTWASLAQRSLVDGEHVFMWGAPGKNTDVYRVGYYVWLAPEPDIDKHFMFQHFILPTFPGDSGSGIFDESGNVVAVVSYADESANECSEPLQFTDAQLDVATEE